MNGPVLAAGAVLWRRGPEGLEVCCVHRPKYDDWSLPKGKREDGEQLVTTAVREVMEETGHRIVLGRPLPEQHYPVEGRPKVVHWWAAEADPGAAAWTGTKEIDRLEFLTVPVALARLDRPADVGLVEVFATDPAPTVPLVVLRHGSALPRGTWTGPDLDRPLAEDGLAESGRVVPVLAAYGITRLMSSDAVRCTQTLEPYAGTAGLPIAVEPRLAEDADGWARDVVAEAVSAGAPTVLCTHRPVVPALLHALGVPTPDRTLAPAGCLVVHHRDGAVVAVERHEV